MVNDEEKQPHKVSLPDIAGHPIVSAPKPPTEGNCDWCGRPWGTFVKPYWNGEGALAPRCEDCVLILEQRAEERVRLQAPRFVQERIDHSGLPDGFRDWTIEKATEAAKKVPHDMTEALEAADRWGGGNLHGLLMNGPVGVGKTFTAAAAARRMLGYRKLRWLTGGKMMAMARSGFESKAYEDLYEILTDSRCPLVLDDMDKVKTSDFSLELLFTAIDERVTNETPLLITTNMRYPELKEEFGETLASRLRGYCKPVTIFGDDLRKGNTPK